MGVVNLGNIKNKPIIRVLKNVTHIWSDAEKVGEPVKLDIPFVFRQDKTYIVLLKSHSGTVTVDGSEVTVSAIDIFTNIEQGVSLSGGSKIAFSTTYFSYAISFVNYVGSSGPGVYILRPNETGAASLFDVGIYEL